MPCRIRFFAAVAALLIWSRVLCAQSAETTAPLPLADNLYPELKALIAGAVQQSPRMVARNAAEAIAENERAIAHAAELPSLGGYVNYFPWDRDYRKSDPQSPYTSQKSAYHLDLVQPVFHWGALEAGTRIAELKEKIAKGDTDAAYQALAHEIRARFLGLVIKKADLARVRVDQQMAEEQLKLAQERFDQGNIAAADLTAAKLAVERARLNTDIYTDDFAASKRVLAKLCGTEPLPDAQIPGVVPEFPVALGRVESILANFTAKKGDSSYVLASLRDQIEMENLNYKIAEARLRPKVNAVIGTSQDEQSYTANIGAKYGVTAYYAGVQVNWSIFDGFATKAVKKNALIRRRELERTYEQATDDILEQARAKFQQVAFAARSLAIAQQDLALAEENLRRTKDNAARGQVSDADLRAAEHAHENTLIGIYRTRAEVLMKTSDFLGAVVADPALANLPASRP